jgi:uridine phosphorylase
VISKLKKKYCISSEDMIKSVLNITNKTKKNFQVGDYVILLFSKLLLEYLIKQTNMQPGDWLAPYHPYASNSIYNGNFDGISISAIMPPMGASPIASVTEDLITCGAKTLLLVCGAWGITKKSNILDFLIPTHAVGPDGTSIYYGRMKSEETVVNEKITKILEQETRKRTEKYHKGKNFSIEAFYKISISQVEELQRKGFVSMENGELNTITTVCKEREIACGAIFYNYFSPLEEWSIPWLEDDYKKCVELEGEITLATIRNLANT